MLTSEDFTRGYDRIMNQFEPRGDANTPAGQERNRQEISEWREMTKGWDKNFFDRAVTTLIRTRQYRSFPQPGELQGIYNELKAEAWRPPSTDEPPRRRYRAKIDLQIEEILTDIGAQTEEDKLAFQARLKQRMIPVLQEASAVVDTNTRGGGTAQPVIYGAFDALLPFETHMQAVKLWAEEKGIKLSRKIPSIFDVPLPSRLTDTLPDTRGISVEQIDQEIATVSDEIYSLAEIRSALWRKRRKITGWEEKKERRKAAP